MRNYYGTGHDATIEEWKIINSADAGLLRKIKNSILSLENEAQECCDQITPFNIKKFENEFFYQRNMFESLQSAYQMYILELKSNHQHGTATGYQTACPNSSRKSNPGTF